MPTTLDTTSIPKHVAKWVSRNRERFGSSDNLPAEFHRQQLFPLLKRGSKVVWRGVQRPGDTVIHLSAGRVQILTRGSHASVLVTGSSGARPALVDVRNIVWCAGAPTRI